MSLAADVLNAVGPALDIPWQAIKPYKEAIFGLLVMLGGGWAAIFKGYRGQASRPEEALSRAASTSPFGPRTVTLARKDRELVREVRDSVEELTSSVRRLGGIIVEHGGRGTGRPPA